LRTYGIRAVARIPWAEVEVEGVVEEWTDSLE
jgi:hypothetical protein